MHGDENQLWRHVVDEYAEGGCVDLVRAGPIDLEGRHDVF